MEPTTGLEPVNLFLTKEVLYLLSYVGPTEENWTARDVRIISLELMVRNLKPARNFTALFTTCNCDTGLN